MGTSFRRAITGISHLHPKKIAPKVMIVNIVEQHKASNREPKAEYQLIHNGTKEGQP
jgi:hypothetical protein